MSIVRVYSFLVERNEGLGTEVLHAKAARILEPEPVRKWDVGITGASRIGAWWYCTHYSLSTPRIVVAWLSRSPRDWFRAVPSRISLDWNGQRKGHPPYLR